MKILGTYLHDLGLSGRDPHFAMLLRRQTPRFLFLPSRRSMQNDYEVKLHVAPLSIDPPLPPPECRVVGNVR